MRLPALRFLPALALLVACRGTAVTAGAGAGVSNDGAHSASAKGQQGPLPTNTVVVTPAPTVGVLGKPSCRSVKNAAFPGASYGSVGNLRVAANPAGALITWHQLDVPTHGDSSQVGQALFVKRGPDGDSDTRVLIPAKAYAAAAYTTLAPSTFDGALDLIGFGVNGATDFMTFRGGAKAWKPSPHNDPFEAVPPTPANAVSLPFSFTESLVAAPTMPLAVLGGAEAPCASYYACKEYEAASNKGFPKSVRSLFFKDKAHVTEVLHRDTVNRPTKPFAPAVAASANADRALTLFRVDKTLQAVWFGADGKKTSSFLAWEGADLGAPAVTFVGTSAYAAWVARTGPKDPYRLYVARISDKAAEVVRELDVGEESAMAPALAPLGDKLAIAWMSGDESKNGRVHLGVLAASALVASSGPSRLKLAEELWLSDPGNHRDPELASAEGRLYLVWADFTIKKAEGVPTLREFTCP